VKGIVLLASQIRHHVEERDSVFMPLASHIRHVLVLWKVQDVIEGM